MAYDEGLAQRIREQLDGRPGLVEKKMFGGIVFMLRGNMAAGVIGDDLIARVGEDAYEGALARPGARVFDFTGKPMRRWVVVDGGAIQDDETLADWLDAGAAYALSLPPKAPGARVSRPKKPKSR